MLRPSDPDAAFWLGSYKSRVERDNPLPHPAGRTAFGVAQDAVGLLACKHTLPAHIQARCIYRFPGFLFTTIPGTFFSGLLSIPSFLSTRWYQRVPWPSCRTLYLAWLNFMKFQWVYLSSLTASFWMTPLLSSISTTTLSCTLAEVALDNSVSLLKVLSSINPDMTHWGAPLVIHLYLDIELLTTIFGCNCPPKFFSTGWSIHQTHIFPI